MIVNTDWRRRVLYPRLKYFLLSELCQKVGNNIQYDNNGVCLSKPINQRYVDYFKVDGVEFADIFKSIDGNNNYVAIDFDNEDHINELIDNYVYYYIDPNTKSLADY